LGNNSIYPAISTFAVQICYTNEFALTPSKMAEACGYRDHSESVNAIDSARKQKPYQKIQGTTDAAVSN
jgi:hypothetical protein